MIRGGVAGALVAMLSAAAASAERSTLDFEGLPEGAVVSEVRAADGAGPIGVRAVNGRFRDGANAAVVFDSSCPPGGVPEDCSGDDADLGTPHRSFRLDDGSRGPGVGFAGRRGRRFENDAALGKVLIVAENLRDADGDGLVDEPDDEGSQRPCTVTFDFSEVGPVTLHEVTVLDVNYRDEPARAELVDALGRVIERLSLPMTDDNGVAVVSLGATPGVAELRFLWRGPGAIDNLVFEAGGARIDLEVSTGGRAAESPEGDDVPWLKLGDAVDWSYRVENTGRAPLGGIEVADERGGRASCPRTELAPGESMTCTATGTVVDPAERESGEAAVEGRCLGLPGRPLHAHTGVVTARGPDGVPVADRDTSHYCAEPGLAGIDVRKQWEGPDRRTVAAGADFRFTIAVTAAGEVGLDEVTVTDAAAPDCERRLGRLEAGATVVYECAVAGLGVGDERLSGCRLENEVCAAGRAGGVEVTDCDPSTVELRAIELRRRLVGRDGEAARFEMVVTNRGCEVEAQRLTDHLLPGCGRDLGALAAGGRSAYECTVEFDAAACRAAARDRGEASFCERTAEELAELAAAAETAESAESDTAEPEAEGAAEAEEPRAGEGTAAPSEPGAGDRRSRLDGAEAAGERGAVAEGADGDEGPESGAAGRPAAGGTLIRVVLLLLLLALLVAAGLFYWNRTRAG